MTLDAPPQAVLDPIPARNFSRFAQVVRPGRFCATGFADLASVQDTLSCALEQRYLDQAVANAAVSAIITTPALAPDLLTDIDAAGRDDLAVLCADDAQRAFYLIHNALISDHGLCAPLRPGIHPDTQIDPTAIVDPHVQIGSQVSIAAGAMIGRGTILDAGVHIGPGALVGVDGHFSKRFGGELLRIRHAGGVRIGARSQVLAGAIVQRALHSDFTQIGTDCVIAPGAQIGHGVSIGDGSTLTGGVIVAGYTRIGRDVWIGPGAVIRNLTEIGDNARIDIGAVIATPVPARGHMAGFFALPRARALRMMAKWMAK